MSCKVPPSPPPFRQELPDTQQQQGRASTKLSSGVGLGGFSLLAILFFFKCNLYVFVCFETVARGGWVCFPSFELKNCIECCTIYIVYYLLPLAWLSKSTRTLTTITIIIINTTEGSGYDNIGNIRAGGTQLPISFSFAMQHLALDSIWEYDWYWWEIQLLLQDMAVPCFESEAM